MQGYDGGRPLRVAFALPHTHIGGIARMTVRLGGELVRRGHDVRLYVPSPDGPGLASRAPGLRVVPLPEAGPGRARLMALRADPAALGHLLLSRRPSETFARLPGLAARLREDAPDVLVAATPELNVEAVWARAAAGAATRLVLTERAAKGRALLGARSRRRRRLPAVMRRNYPRADAVVAVSDGVADDLAALTGLPRERVRTIYNPTCPDDLDARLAAPFEHPFLADGQPPVVLAVGRLVRQKGYPSLLRAFARARAGRAMRLLVIGGNRKPGLGDARAAELRALAAGLGVAADVDLAGFVANPFPAMARAGVLALASEFEGFPNVLVEALACGTPVVSTDCPGGSAEILGGGRYGRLVPVGDEAAMAAAILATLDEEPRRDLLRARAAEFGVARAADAYLGLFGELLARA